MAPYSFAHVCPEGPLSISNYRFRRLFCMKVLKTVVADDHDVVRKGLIYLLSLSGRSEVVGEARDGLELLPLVERASPDLAIIDIAMPRLNGIDAAARIRQQSAGTAVIILSL